MKLKVIGWTYYDDPSYEYFETTWATQNAVLKDIIENGYEFTGYHHQERDYCCPVLNNGKKIIFSQRGFGGVMAQAHGLNGLYDYSTYAYPVNYNSSDYNFPTTDPDESLIVDEKTLYETFEIDADLTMVATADINNELTLPDEEKYALIEVGDFVKLNCDKHTSKFKIVSVDREKDVSVVDEYRFKYRDCDIFSEEESEEIIEKYLNAKTIIKLKLQYWFGND